MAYSWRNKRIARLNGLQLKINPTDVPDGSAIDCKNVYQGSDGVISKRKGNTVMFNHDETGSTEIDELAAATLGTTKYYFKFAGGSFRYATSLTGTQTTITPSPTIATGNPIWWVVLDDKLFFVDGDSSHPLRYFDGSQIRTSSIYQRPTVAPGGTGGSGFDYVYTVDNGLGESPASPAVLNQGSATNVNVDANTGPQTLNVGDTVRVYSKSTAIATNYRLVATYSWPGGVTNSIPTTAIADTQTQLYSEIGLALNKTAPTGLKGITAHYGRLIGWKSDYVYCSKSSNPHSWPDEQAVQEAFVYGFAVGDSESIQSCVSFRESLFVLKDTKVATFVGIGPDDTGGNRFAFRRIETYGIGCIAPKSAVIIGEAEKAYLIFLGKQGFYGTDGNEPIRLGGSIDPEILNYSIASLQDCQAVYHKRQGFYYAALGPVNARKIYIFDTREDNGVQVGWFRLEDIKVSSIFYDEDRLLIGTYDGVCLSERVNNIGSDYQDAKYEFISTSSVNTATDQITVSLSYTTGDTVRLRTNGTAPSGLNTNIVYYVIVDSPTLIRLATSAANATGGISIDITSTGSGTHSLISSKAISAYYTTNFMNFGTPSHVKKVSKPSIIVNAIATSINLTIETAYDWIRNYSDPLNITTGSTHLWGDDLWGAFIWGSGSEATPKNIGIARRKFRSISYKFSNSTINQDFNLQGFEQLYDVLRNRGNYA